MILLVTPVQPEALLFAIQKVIQEPVDIALTFEAALDHARQREYSVVILDHDLAEAEPVATEALLGLTAAAFPLQLRLALTSAERLGREIRSALRRRQLELRSMEQSAVRSLHAELRDMLTAMLLQCDLMADSAGVSPEVRDTAQAMQQIVGRVRSRLVPYPALV